MLSEAQALREFPSLALCYRISGVPKTIDEIRRENLQALAESLGGPAVLARLLGRSDSQVSQWIKGSPDSKTGKPRGLRPSSCRLIEAAAGKPRGWLDADHTAEGAAAASPIFARQAILTNGEIEISPHSMPPTLSWEKLLTAHRDLPTEFTAAVPDDALQDTSPKGTLFAFRRDIAPIPGRAVLVRDKAGSLYMRRYTQGVGARWFAQATNDAYATLDSERDGLSILGVAVAKWISGGDA